MGQYDDLDINDLYMDSADNTLFSGKITRRDFLLSAAGLSVAGLAGLTPFDAVAANTTPLNHLERAVDQYIKQQRRRGRVAADERTAWSVYDFHSSTKWVSINENKPLQSASMMKPFVAQAYFYRHRENSRRYPYDTQVKHLMEAMIRNSSNRATNELIKRVGYKRAAAKKPKEVERLLKRYAGHIFQQTSIVEYIPRNGRTYRNKASARDYSRFLYAIWNNRLPFAEDIKDYMGMPNEDRIKRGTSLPRQIQVYDKTGSTARLCGNMGIVVAPGKDGKQYPYTFIGIIEKRRRTRSYTSWIRRRSDVMREVSDLVYQMMRNHYALV